MDKTRVEDSLIKMIQPKIHEIKEKFSQGKSLTQNDINTLLLKLQYNHINHLDLKVLSISKIVLKSLNKRLTATLKDWNKKLTVTLKNLNKDWKVVLKPLNKNSPISNKK